MYKTGNAKALKATDNEAGTRKATTWVSATTLSDLVAGGCQLKSLLLDTLKIDIAFVRDLTRDMQATPIAATIIALAKSLNLSVIAEGVETGEQREVLAGLGCRAYQGYLFGRPVPLEHFDPAPLSANHADISTS